MIFFEEEGEEEEEEASEQVVGSSQVGVSFHHLTNDLLPRLVSAHSPPLAPPSPSSRPHTSKSPSLCFALCALTLHPVAQRMQRDVPPVARRAGVLCLCVCVLSRFRLSRAFQGSCHSTSCWTVRPPGGFA